jgi:peptidoglycan/LPS O-acetylase OafA/YrhL
MSWLPGGYFGVDMFFVVSGYLITSIVWTEVQEHRFSIALFYERRIRRILPALLLLLVFATVAAVALLLPPGLIDYGKSLLATAAFLANIYFWRDTNYFSPNAGEKPLLHLWSLGVEEQFYILFPPMLLLLARYRPTAALVTVAALTVASLCVNTLAVYIGADSPAFFLLPTRAWELGVGAVLAILPTASHPTTRRAEIAAAVGALLVIAGLAHPVRLYGCVPESIFTVAGTALLVYAGERTSPERNYPFVNRLLSLPVLVFFGLISYSLYLWHWPILVFSRYYLVRELRAHELIAALLLMLVCATFSWRFIERPFRNKTVRMRLVGCVVGGTTAALVVGALIFIGAHGLPERLNAAAAVINESEGNNYRCPISEYLKFGSSRACQLNLPSRNPADAQVVLLGNSHAQMYAPAWQAVLSARGELGLLVPLNGCLPTVQANITSACLQAASQNLAAVSSLRNARTIIIGLTWNYATGELVDAQDHSPDNTHDQALVSAIDDLIDRLQRAGKRVILIGPLAEPGFDVASVVSRQLAFGHPLDRPSYASASEFHQRFDAAIEHFESRKDIAFARPDRVECIGERCNYFVEGHALFADSNHIAANEVQRFEPVFAAALSSR